MHIYAHRGARGYAPENTMAAFVKALDLKADGIELDVQATRDGEVVICHDHTIDRTSNGTGLLHNFTLAELKEFDFGSWFGAGFCDEPIPTLSDFFAWYVTTPLLLNIEIKHGPVIYHGLEEKVIACMNRLVPKEFDLYKRVLISSFYHPSLLKMKELDSRFKTAVLFAHRPVDVLSLIHQTNANYVHPHWHYLEKEWITVAHSEGIGVNSYTINEQDEFNFIRDMQLDGLITDFPDRWR